MDAQLPLQFDRPRSRRSDPLSSHVAGIDAAKFARSQAAKVLRAVLAFPGLTAKQLAERAGLDRYMVARRAPELEGEAGEVGWITRVEPEPGAELVLFPTERAKRWEGTA